MRQASMGQSLELASSLACGGRVTTASLWFTGTGQLGALIGGYIHAGASGVTLGEHFCDGLIFLACFGEEDTRLGHARLVRGRG